MKRISVITINFNNATGLEDTIKSVVDQKGLDFEFLVIDGGSADASREIIEKYKSNISYWISEKDNGIYHAQNKGILKAKGEYCLFLNSGDVFADATVLQKVNAELKDVDILYGDIITRDKTGKTNYLNSPEKIGVYEMMISTLWHPSAFIKKELFEKLGLYDEAFKVAGDYEFFVRSILKHNVVTRHIHLAIALFDLGGISNTPRMQELQSIERKKSWELNFSEPVIEVFENNTRLLRSREYKLGKLAMKILKPFRGKK